MPLSAGTRLGPYEIVALRGAGGMGEVYRARDTRLDRAVAIKILPSADPDLKARFEREAKAIAALAHPHICTLFDVANQDGTDYLVMEYLEGETLADKLQRGSLKCQDCRRCRDCRGALPAIARWIQIADSRHRDSDRSCGDHPISGSAPESCSRTGLIEQLDRFAAQRLRWSRLRELAWPDGDRSGAVAREDRLSRSRQPRLGRDRQEQPRCDIECATWRGARRAGRQLA